jgi:peroxiredoxin family protein
VAHASGIAAVLASGAPEELYSGLSLLVSSAAPSIGLATFRALDLIMDPHLAERVRDPGATPALSADGRGRFAASLVELLDTACALDTVGLYACSASVETMAIAKGAVEARLDGVMSTPRFLREAAGAQLIFV